MGLFKRKLMGKIKPSTLSTEYGEYAKSMMDKFTFLNSIAEENKVVFIGDSITEAYPLSEFFEGIVYNRGISGDTSDRLLERLDCNCLNIKPRTVVILIGTNDLNFLRKVEDIIRDICAIVDKICTTLPKCKVIIQSVYPTRQLPTRKICDINAINAAVEKYVANLKNVVYVDLTKALSDEDGEAKRVFFNDGLHPNIHGYVTISKELKKYLN